MFAERSGECFFQIPFGYEGKTVFEVIADLMPDDGAGADTVDGHHIASFVHNALEELMILIVGGAFSERFHAPIILHLGRGATIAPMEIPVRRVDTEVSLPEYKTVGAAAMDCPIREDVEIPPKSVAMVSLNVSLKPPRGHFVLLAARSRSISGDS